MNNDELQKAIDDITRNTVSAPVNTGGVKPATVIDIPAAPEATPEVPEPAEVAATVEPVTNISSAIPATEQMATPRPAAPAMSISEMKGDMTQMKEDVLRELIPLMNRTNIEPKQKYKICKDAAEFTHDKGMLESAYHAAREIKDDQLKAEALVELVSMIDKW